MLLTLKQEECNLLRELLTRENSSTYVSPNLVMKIPVFATTPGVQSWEPIYLEPERNIEITNEERRTILDCLKTNANLKSVPIPDIYYKIQKVK